MIDNIPTETATGYTKLQIFILDMPPIVRIAKKLHAERILELKQELEQNETDIM